MGLMTGIMGFLFGDGRNVIADTAEVFRENAENGAVRAADAKSQSLQQFAAEFAHQRRGVFDRFVDGLNRLPRPMLALGTIWMFIAAMRRPDEFMRGMEGLALVPEPLWWLMGAIVSFYFGARHQAKEQDFQRAVAGTVAAVQTHKAPISDNPALDDWQAQNG
jgi:hypothetical protein